MIAIWEEVLKTVSEFSEEEQKILVSRWLREVKMPDFIKIIRDEMKWEKSFSESQGIRQYKIKRAAVS